MTSHGTAQARRGDLGLRMRWDILEALATYHLMTAELLMRAGVGRDLRRVREAAWHLVRLDLIAFREKKFIQDEGTRSGLYWLRPKGVETLATEGIEAHCSDRTLRTRNEVQHRLAIVETHIALRHWAATIDATVWAVQDFAPDAPGRQKATTVDLRCLAAGQKSTGTFIPDLLAKVTPPDGITRLLVFEIERGGENGDLSEFRRWKLPKLRKVIASDELADVLGVENRARFLVVFKDARCREKALAKWPAPVLALWDDVYVKALDELAGEFGGGWWQPGGRRRCHLIEGVGLGFAAG